MGKQFLDRKGVGQDDKLKKFAANELKQKAWEAKQAKINWIEVQEKYTMITEEELP
jgi:hypothetical protein